jgi:mxaK protein
VSLAPQKIRLLANSVWGLCRRGATVLIVGSAILCALGAAAASLLLGINAERNRTIADLVDGRDIAVAPSAAPEVLFARAYFLITHDRLDDAQQLIGMLDLSAGKRLRADLHYNIANARLRLAFDKVEIADFDAAGALVGLAREDYREALLLDPGSWNARFNYDVASRLVRQYPAFRSTPDERRRGPRALWTEMPNRPRGEP